jgi:hypothetical protein
MSVEAKLPKELMVGHKPRATIVISGQAHPMRPDAAQKNTFLYDYRMPPNQNEVAYYYVFDYQGTSLHGANVPCHHEVTSDLYTLQVVNRYVSMLESQRGLVNTLVHVTGRGFARTDKVWVGEVEAQTYYVSPHNLAFRVPLVEAGQSYNVRVQSASDVLHVGTFFVDAAVLHPSHPDIQLACGDRMTLGVKVDFDAPAGGIPIRITTDVPQSLIIDPVTVPAGARSVTFPILAAQAGRGELYLEAPGFAECVLPVTVIERQADPLPQADQSAPTLPQSAQDTQDAPPDALNAVPQDLPFDDPFSSSSSPASLPDAPGQL